GKACRFEVAFALDLYSWMSAEQEIIYWEELINVLQKHFGPPEFQNPDKYLCSIKQTGSVHEYRQEFARRSARISNWPDHRLLGVFLNGLKDELKADDVIPETITGIKTYDPDLNELDQFIAIFGIWLDPLGQEKNEIVEWQGAVYT
ncbi:retrotransposon gag domain, retroviral aspartyl protease, partial [Tanacetum coccineum]